MNCHGSRVNHTIPLIKGEVGAGYRNRVTDGAAIAGHGRLFMAGMIEAG